MTEPQATPTAPVNTPTTPAPTAAPAALAPSSKGTLHLKPAATAPGSVATPPAQTPPANPTPTADPNIGSLLDIVKEGQEPSKEGEAKKLAGKYETVEELEKAYTEAQKKISEGAPKVPETYALDKALTEAGLPARDVSTNAEAYADYDKRLKEIGITQEQLPKLLTIYKGELDIAAQELAKKYGPQPNREQEYGKLQATWGAATQARLQEVATYAKANLPPTVASSISKTAEGVEWLHGLMQKSYGPVPMRTAPVSAPDPLTLSTQLKEVITSKAYQNVHHPDHKAVTEQAINLIKQQQQQQR